MVRHRGHATGSACAEDRDGLGDRAETGLKDTAHHDRPLPRDVERVIEQ